MGATVPQGDIGLTLALAVFAASNAPILLLDGNQTIVAASDSFCATFDVSPTGIAGMSIYDLDGKSWDVPRLRAFMGATISGLADVDAYELNITTKARGPRRLVLKLQKLEYGDRDHKRFLITIVDVTEARRSEQVQKDLLHHNSTLLHEVQHRVANSLQIIASILTQSARRVQSQEVRTHLSDAHQRVMSLATLQRQLAETGGGAVDLAPYLAQLCASLGASMIYDHAQLTITTRVDPVSVSSEISVSLGLVVTELVINALKHAFPDERHGHVVVDYAAQDDAWTLAVADDGVGMSLNPDQIKAGLGTSIVQALAMQMDSTITTVNTNPGTRVSLSHPGTREGPARS